MRSHRTVSILLAVLATLGALSACSSSGKAGGDAAAGTTADNGSCPFSGTTAPQSQPGGSAPTTLTGATPATDGCIDNVQLNFSPTLAASKFAYQAGGPVLVVTLTGTTLGGGLSTGTTQNPKNLNHVKQVQVTAQSGNVTVEITLDEKRPFLVSSSKVPAQLELSIG